MELKGGSGLRAASSLAHLADVIATRKDVFTESNLRFKVAIGSKGGQVSTLRTSCKDHCGRGCCHGGVCEYFGVP